VHASCRGWVEEKVFRTLAEWMVLDFDAYMQKSCGRDVLKEKPAFSF